MTFDASGSPTLTGPPAHERSCSKLAELLDVRFERHFTPMLGRWLYVGSLTLIVAVTLFALIAWGRPTVDRTGQILGNKVWAFSGHL